MPSKPVLFKAMCGAIAPLLGLLFATPLIGLQRQELELKFRSVQTDLMLGELQALANTLGLPKGWSKDQKEALEAELDLAVERFFSGRDPTDRRSPDFRWEPGFRKSAWDRIAKATPESDAELVEHLRQDREVLEREHDEVSQETAISFLDSYLCLSRKQCQSMKETLSRAWRSEWNLDVGGMGLNGFAFLEEIVFEVDPAELAETLTAQQKQVYSEINKYATGRARMLMFKNGNADYGTLPIKEACDGLIDFKIAEYQRDLELEGRQVDFFGIAKKGAVSRVVREWQSLIERLRDDPNWMRTISRDPDVLRAIAVSPLQQCVNRPEWKKTLAKILNEEQLNTIADRERERVEACEMQLANHIVFAFFGKRAKLLFTSRQHEELVSLVQANIDLEYGGDLVSAIKGVAQITDGEFESILTEPQWRCLQPVMNKERELIENMFRDEGE
jgi:hypothetical protein